MTVNEKIQRLEAKQSRLEKEHWEVLNEIARLKHSCKDELLKELKDKFMGKWVATDEGKHHIQVMRINDIAPFSNSDTYNFVVSGQYIYISREQGYYSYGFEKNTYSVSDLNEMRFPSTIEVDVLIRECKDGFDNFVKSIG